MDWLIIVFLVLMEAISCSTINGKLLGIGQPWITLLGCSMMLLVALLISGKLNQLFQIQHPKRGAK